MKSVVLVALVCASSCVAAIAIADVQYGVIVRTEGARISLVRATGLERPAEIVIDLSLAGATRVCRPTPSGLHCLTADDVGRLGR